MLKLLYSVAKFLYGLKPNKLCVLIFLHHCSVSEREENNVKENSIYAGNAATRPRKVWLVRDLSLDFLP